MSEICPETARMHAVHVIRIRGRRLVFMLAMVVAVASLIPKGAAAQSSDRQAFDLQGHRGARGLLPENSIPGFLRALDLGVETLEMDVAISQDERVVLSHEPWMSSAICRSLTGEAIEEDDERSYNIYRMPYAAIAGFDCGGRGHSAFPDQRPTAVSKPLLRDVIRIADGYAGATGRPLPRYNIEIKSRPEFDGTYHPAVDAFAALLYDVIAEEGVLDRVTIQSFDPRALRAARSIDGGLSLALLVGNENGYQQNMEALTFTPDIYSPNHELVDHQLMADAHAAGVKVIPWTVNDEDEMRRLLNLGVDGLITDYPNIGRAVVDTYFDQHDH